MIKRPIVYMLVGLLSFGGIGGGTYFLLQGNNTASQPTTEPDDDEPILSVEEQTAADRFMTNLLKGDLEVNELNVGIDTGAENIGINFTGAISYDGTKLAGGDMSAISASGDLTLNVSSFKETINIVFPGDNTLYFTVLGQDFSVQIDSFSTIMDLIPLFTASEAGGDQLDETTATNIKKAASLDLDLGSLLDDLTGMLENIQEIKTETGYEFILEIPDLAKIVLISDENERLAGLRLDSPIEIEGMKISLDAKITAHDSSVVKGPNGEYNSLDGTLKSVVNTLTEVLDSKQLTANFNVKAQSTQDDSLDLDLSGRLSADLSQVAQDFENGTYELSILPKGVLQGNPQPNSIDVHYGNQAVYLKVNNLLKAKITNQTIEDIIAIVTEQMGDTESLDETSSMLDDLFGGSILLELIDGNLENLGSMIKEVTSSADYLKITLSEEFLATAEPWSVTLGYENESLKSLEIKDFTIADFAIDLSLDLEKSFSSAAIFNDLTQFKDYRKGLSIYNTIAEILDTMTFATDFNIGIKTDDDSFDLSGEIAADLNGVDFNNIESLLDAKLKLSAQAKFEEKQKAVSVQMQDSTLFLEYNNIISNSLKVDSIVDLVDTISSKFGPIEISSNEEVNIDEILSIFSLEVSQYSEMIDKLMEFDFTALEDFIYIDHLNDDPSKLTVKILPNKESRTYIYIEISTADEQLSQIRIENLHVGDAIFSLELNIKDYQDITIQDTEKYAPLDSLMGNLNKLVGSSQMNINLSATVVDDDASVDPILLDAAFQMDNDTTEFYGAIDLSAKLPIDKDVFTHHIQFDNYTVEGQENELLLKYYGNDQTSNPFRAFISDGEFGRMLDVITNIPEDNSLMFILATTSDISINMPLMDIINGEFGLLFNDYLTLFDCGPNKLEIHIDGAIFGLDTTLKLEINHNDQGIDTIKIKDLRFGTKTINVSVEFNKYDSSLEATRLHNVEPRNKFTYINFNYMDLFLQIGINTTQSRKYHLYGTFNLSFDTSGLIGGIAGLLLGDVQIYSSIDMKLEINDVDGSVNAQIVILRNKSNGNSYSTTENGYRKTEFYILSNNDCIVHQTRVNSGYREKEVFKVTQSEMVNNLHYYLLKYTFNMSDMIFDIINDAVVNPKEDSSGTTDILNFDYQNIIPHLGYNADDREFSLTIDLGSIVNLSAITSMIKEDTITIAFTHTSNNLLESLTIEGTPVSIQILGSMIAVGLYLKVYNDTSNTFTMQDFNSFVRNYNEDPIKSNLPYYYYREGNTGAIYLYSRERI